MAGLFIRSETARGERPARAGAIAGGGAAALIEAYREARSARGEPVTPFELFEAISTDAAMRLPAMRIADLQSAHTPETYAYLFTHRSPAADGVFGSCHTLDVPFVWGSCGGEAAKPFVGDGPRIESLSARMQDGWLAFARTGNPSHGGLPAWPPYDAARRATMVLGDTSQVEDAPRDAERRAWETVRGAGNAPSAPAQPALLHECRGGRSASCLHHWRASSGTSRMRRSYFDCVPTATTTFR